MTYVIAQGCCNDASCVSVCPVDCIRPRPGDPEFLSAEQLYIDPIACIDCAACLWECPVNAIYDEIDMPAEFDVFKTINQEYFEAHPLDVSRPTTRSRRSFPADRTQLRVAVIGAGPAGCYAAEELSKLAEVEVSMFDRLPTPYGLVRAGVAPDHLKTKQVTAQFEQVLRRPNVSCYFNVRLGPDLTVDEILERHHAVIYAAGADADRKPGIPGEDLPGAYSAREFVSWYNGHPEHAARVFDLSGERVVVIGNGNVALDVARVLVSPSGTYDPTDMAEFAVAALRQSNVREVVVAARRGVTDAAYATAEMMALTRIDGVDVLADEDEVRLGIDEQRLSEFGVERKLELALAAAARQPEPNNRTIVFRYLLTPVAVNGADSVESVTFRRTSTDGSPSDQEETLPTRLVLFSTGYRGTAMDGIPFDPVTATIPNQLGRVIDPTTGQPAPGLYCTGWAKRGATGVIGSNRVCSAETVDALLEDFAAGRLADPPRLLDDVGAFIADRQPDVVRFDEWVRIDAAEQSRGAKSAVTRPRQKFHAIKDMIEAAREQ
jgi:ferredoxin--NADP+ reductase